MSASHALILVSGVRSSCDASIMNSLLMRSTSRSSANTACSSSAVWAICRARATTISRASRALASETTKKRNSRDRVAERGDVGATGGGWTEEDAQLRHLTGEPHLHAEDAPRMTPAGEHRDLVGDPRPGGIDQVHQGDLQPLRGLEDAHDLLDRARPPRSRLDRRVIRHHRAGATVERADAGDDTIRGEVAGEVVGEEPVLDEVRALVEQPGDALAWHELALLVELGTGLLRPPGARHVSP